MALHVDSAVLGYDLRWAALESKESIVCTFKYTQRIVHTWALMGLPYQNFGVYVYTIKLHGAFGTCLAMYAGMRVCGCACVCMCVCVLQTREVRASSLTESTIIDRSSRVFSCRQVSTTVGCCLNLWWQLHVFWLLIMLFSLAAQLPI